MNNQNEVNKVIDGLKQVIGPELSAQEMIESLCSESEQVNGGGRAIYDHDEVTKFLQWLMSPHARRIAEQLREQRTTTEE